MTVEAQESPKCGICRAKKIKVKGDIWLCERCDYPLPGEVNGRL